MNFSAKMIEMIITVTMNPAIDKTVEIDCLNRGGLNRIKTVEYDAGGKGINVSKTIAKLGGESLATGFLGGNAGNTILNVLDKNHIKHDFVFVEGETRTNTKVYETQGGVTELNEPGPVIGEEPLKLFMEKIESYAAPDVLFILAGSVPAGIDKSIYRNIIELVHQKGAKVLLDADGELFKNALPAVPDLMKPNREELSEFCGETENITMEEILKLGQGFRNAGTELVAVSMGKDGAMLLKNGFEVRCPAVEVEKKSTVGAGDAMVAALAYAWDQKLDDVEMVKLCMAVSAGAVTTAGTKPPTKELVEQLKEQVQIEFLKNIE